MEHVVNHLRKKNRNFRRNVSDVHIIKGMVIAFLDKEKHMENAKAQEQTEPEMAEAERVEAEIVYSPMVAEPQEYQYNADAFENYLRDNAANDNKNKEIIMQKDKNIR